MSLVQELFHVFLFIIIFIVIHIVVVHLTDRRLSVNIRQRILVEDGGPVIQIRSISREKQRQLELEQRKLSQWEQVNGTVSTSFHLKYKPVSDWPERLDDTERWDYFKTACAARNITQTEIIDCAFDSEIFRRRVVVRNICKRNTDSLAERQQLNPYKLFALIPRRLVWCPVYKAASTNWMKNIPRLMSSPGQISNLTKKDGKNRQANVLARALVPLLPSKALVRFLSSEPRPVVFMIVRHPFDRLLSAYRDKLERYNKYYYDKYGRAIVQKYRKRGVQRFGREFYDKKGQNGSPVPSETRTGSEPTFWEFVTAILETGIMDEHWTPIMESCSVCAEKMRYDFIIKYEDLAREESYLVRRLGLEKVIRPRWENKQSPDNATTSQVRDLYYNMLTENEIWQLYSFYQMDFKLFEYEVDPKYLIRYYKP